MDFGEIWEEHQQTIMIAGAIVIGIVMVGSFIWQIYGMFVGGQQVKQKKKEKKVAGRNTPAGQSEQKPEKKKEQSADLYQQIQKLRQKEKEEPEKTKPEPKPEPEPDDAADTYVKQIRNLKTRLQLRQDEMKTKIQDLRERLAQQRKTFKQKVGQRDKRLKQRAKQLDQTKQQVKELYQQIQALKNQTDQQRAEKIRTASTYPAFKPKSERSLNQYDVHPSKPGTKFDGMLENGLRVVEGQQQRVMLALDNGDRIRAVAVPNAQSSRIDVEMDKKNPGLYIDTDTGKRYRIYGRLYSNYDRRAGLPAEVETSTFSGTMLAVLSGALGAGAEQYSNVQQARQDASTEGGDASGAGSAATNQAGAKIASEAAKPFKQTLDMEARRRIMAPATVTTEGDQDVTIEVFPEPASQLNEEDEQGQNQSRRQQFQGGGGDQAFGGGGQQFGGGS